MRIIRLPLACIFLLLLCSCATTPPPAAFVPAPELPATVAMNEDAGRGNLLIVPIRLEHGKKLPFLVDTGAPVTCLDESLEPELGKRIRAGTAFDGSGVKHKMSVFAATKLYLGNTRLMTGNLIVTMNFRTCRQSKTGSNALSLSHCPRLRKCAVETSTGLENRRPRPHDCKVPGSSKRMKTQHSLSKIHN